MFEEEKISNIVKIFDSGKTQQAITELLKLIKKYPDKLEYTFLYGKMCNSLNRLDEAAEACMKMLSIDEKDTDAINAMGTIFEKKGHYERAKSYFLMALDINNNLFLPKINIATIYQKELQSKILIMNELKKLL